jgi:small conductance mechanosensitive channel
MEEKPVDIKKTIILLILGGGCMALDLYLLSSTLLRVLAMAFLVMAAAELVGVILGAIKPKSHRGRTLCSILRSAVRYAAAIVILCWGLSILGVDVNTIVASMGILTLVVGFGAESLIADVITGVFMLFEGQYNVGDIVEVNGFRGTVREIGIRTTSIVDAGENIKIINNSEMKNLLNRSDNLSRTVSDIAIPYDTDLEALEAKLPAMLESIYEASKEVFLSAPRYLGVQALGDSAVMLRFVADVAEKDIYNGNRALNRALLLGFRRAGVECPFPQLDVHNR